MLAFDNKEAKGKEKVMQDPKMIDSYTHEARPNGDQSQPHKRLNAWAKKRRRREDQGNKSGPSIQKVTQVENKNKGVIMSEPKKGIDGHDPKVSYPKIIDLGGGVKTTMNIRHISGNHYTFNTDDSNDMRTEGGSGLNEVIPRVLSATPDKGSCSNIEMEDVITEGQGS